MLAAARLGDEISHTQQRSGLLAGMIIGALVVGAVVLAVASGGTAIPALIAVGAVLTGAAVGGGIGRLIGGEMTVPKGAINKAASTVFVNSRATPAARSCIDTALCQDHTLQLIATGSTTVYVEKFPAARVSDLGACSFKISKGSGNVFIGGATGQCAGVDIAPEVEPWLEWTHRIIGWVGGLCLLGPAYGLRVAIASLIGGEFGAMIGGEIGQHYGGKWGGVAGSILGGIIGGGIPLRPGVRSFINRLEVDPNALGMNGGNIRLRPKMNLGEIDEYGTLKGKTGEGLLDRDHQPSKGALKERAEQLKGSPLTAEEAKRIENRAQTIAVPKDVHQAGPTWGYKNTPELIRSDASDLAGAATRDADAMVENARQLDPNNLSIYENGAQRMKDWASDNKAIDDWLKAQLDKSGKTK